MTGINLTVRDTSQRAELIHPKICLCSLYILKTNAGSFFLKINDPEKFPGMFTVEANGFEAISSAVAAFTLKVVAHAEDSGLMLLVLEYTGPGKHTKKSWMHFSEGLHPCIVTAVMNSGMITTIA